MQPDAAGRGETLVPGTQRELPRTLDALVQDPVAFRHWYDMVLPRVYRYLLARAGDTWLAEELTQQTFVEAIRQRRTFDGRSDAVSAPRIPPAAPSLAESRAPAIRGFDRTASRGARRSAR